MPTMKTWIALLPSLACAAAAAAAADDFDIEPGMWEMTAEMQLTGAPPQMAAMMRRPASTKRECIKERRIDFHTEEMGAGCSFTSTRHNASKLSWDIQCSHAGQTSSGHGESHFAGDTLSGWFEINMQGGATGHIKMKHIHKGRRVGDC
jgi:hypothetical protein